MIDDASETGKKRVIGLRVGGEHGTLSTVAISLILRADDRHSKVVGLDEDNLGVVLRQVHMVEATLHKPIELHRLTSSLEVGHQSSMCYKVATAQTQEAREESVGSRESRHIYVGTPSLPQYPTEQTERV